MYLKMEGSQNGVMFHVWRLLSSVLLQEAKLVVPWHRCTTGTVTSKFQSPFIWVHANYSWHIKNNLLNFSTPVHWHLHMKNGGNSFQKKEKFLLSHMNIWTVSSISPISVIAIICPPKIWLPPIQSAAGHWRCIFSASLINLLTTRTQPPLAKLRVMSGRRARSPPCSPQPTIT